MRNINKIIFIFLFISNILNCSKENKKYISEEITAKISYAIPTLAQFTKNIQEFIGNVISAQESACIKKENNKKIYDKCKISESMSLEGQVEEQNSKYKITFNVSSTSSPQFKAEISGETSIKGGRFIFENFSLHIRKENDGLPQDLYFSLSNISFFKFSSGYALRTEQEKIGKINIELGDIVDLDLINFEYAQYQNGTTLDITIKGEIISHGGCIEKSTYNLDIRTKSEIKESGETQFIIPVCAKEITGKINSANVEIKKDLCSIPQNICKFTQ